MLVDLIPLMIGGAAIAHCSFLSVVLLQLSTKLANKLLASTLLFLAVRIGGCIGGLMYPDFEITGLYLGAVSFGLLGPIIYYYLHSLWNPSFRLQAKHYYQLIPASAIMIVFPLVNVYVAFGLYLFAELTMIIYFVLGFVMVKKVRYSNRLDNMRWKWTLYFSTAIGIIFLLFLSQSFFFDSIIYQGIIIGSALVLYALTLAAIKQVKLFMYEPRDKNKKQRLETLAKEIEALLKEDAIFTDPLMNVSALAKHLKVPSYQISLAVNTYFEKSFPEMINTLRIRKAEELLANPDKSHFTVESIAYESGFSTLSAFYASFKKVNRKTPMKFRNHSLETKANGVSSVQD